MTRAHLGWIAAAVALTSLSSGCDGVRGYRARARVPRVVLITLDTLHVSRVTPYNPEVKTTPFLDRFARDGVRFEYAYTHTPITLPSHASIMTGVAPPSLGVMANGDRVPDEAETLAEILKRAGYQTSAFISLGVLQKPFGLVQGFDEYHDPFDTGPVRWYRRAHEIFEPISDWLTQHRDAPFFLWVHFSDPHEPYVVPDAPPDTELYLDDALVGRFRLATAEHQEVDLELSPGPHQLEWRSLWKARPDDRPDTRLELTMLAVTGLMGTPANNLVDSFLPVQPSLQYRLDNPDARTSSVSLAFAGMLNRPPPSFVLPNYDRNIQSADAHIERLHDVLRELGIEEDTLTVIVSDHGEGLFAHDILGHASHVYEDQLRVVWMMRGAGLPSGRVIDDRPALLTDVAATLLDLLDLPGESVEGRSWLPCIEGGECPENEPWWSYGINHDSRGLTGMASYHWPYKWMWRRGFRRIAFDPSTDPTEENDLLANPGPHNPEPLKDSAESFRAERRRLSRVLEGSAADEGSEERDRLLRSLGYLGGKRSPAKNEER